MTGLFYRLFSCSYDALRDYDRKPGDFTFWVERKKAYNLQLNELIFSYIAEKHSGDRENAMSQQFYLDCINTNLKKHYNRRLKIYHACKQRQLFCMVSLLFAWGEMLLRFAMAVRKFRYVVLFKKDFDFETTDLSIGFPNHAYSYEKENTYTHPRSFAEFLVRNECVEQRPQNLVSLHEFERRSKKHEKEIPANATFPSIYEHAKASIQLGVQGWAKALGLLRKTRSEYRSRIKGGNLFLLEDYLGQSFVARQYLSFFDQVEQGGTRIRKIFVIAFFEMGLIKYGSSYDERLFVFSYSQNMFVPPALLTSEALLSGQMRMNLQQVHEECEPIVLSFYGHNPVGFTGHCWAIDSFKSVINAHYGLSLPVTGARAESHSVNVGYETCTPLQTKQGLKTIMVFDVPIDKKEKDVIRNIIGDRTTHESYLRAFYEDIVTLAGKYNCQILFKPKYSLSSPEFPEVYKRTIHDMRERAGERFVVLDPYTVLTTKGQEIDLSISFTFTSTYYSMAASSRRSIFYAPDPYAKEYLQTMPDTLVLGRERLESIIKYL